jgi:nucleoside-diphosphate-sugar epimerase
VINGSGDQIRSYCYSEDTARGVVEALLRPEAVGQVINLGNSDRPTSIEGAGGSRGQGERESLG